MITVYIRNNVKREQKIVDSSTTLRQAFEMANVDYTQGVTNLDGCALSPGDLDKTFEELNVAEKCYLTNVTKADNAR